MGLISVIKYEGDTNTVVWKHPTVDFNSGTQLIVHESQEAIFFLNGEALDSFGPGEHILDTGKLPLLSNKLFGKLTNNEVFHSEVVFVNLVDHMMIPWGTNPKIKYIDQSEGEKYPFEIGIFGELSLKIIEPRKVVINLVGTENAWGQEMLISRFRSMLMQKLRNQISKSLSSQNISIYELDLHTEEIANDVKNVFNSEIVNYGIEISGFWISGFLYPENDPMYQELKELRRKRVTAIREQAINHEIMKNDLEFGKKYETERVQLDAEKNIISAKGSNTVKILGAEADKTATILNAQAEAERIREEAVANSQRRNLEGITSIQEHAYAVAEKIAENDNVGNMANTGIGLGMMGGMASGVGSVMAGMTTDALSPISNLSNQNSSYPDMTMGVLSVMPDISQEQSEISAGDMDFKTRVRKLKAMMDEGLLSQEEFEEQKRRLLSEI